MPSYTVTIVLGDTGGPGEMVDLGDMSTCASSDRPGSSPSDLRLQMKDGADSDGLVDKQGNPADQTRPMCLASFLFRGELGPRITGLRPDFNLSSQPFERVTTRGLCLATSSSTVTVMNEIPTTTTTQRRATETAIHMVTKAVNSKSYRARQKALGIPTAVRVDQSLVEAVAFLVRACTPTRVSIGVADLHRVAVIVLVREGYDRRRSIVAVGERMKPRDEHTMPNVLPSTRLFIEDNLIEPPRNDTSWRQIDLDAIKRIASSMRVVTART
jgi:hypothetical protein